jgi:polyhydroxyalkanoate synthesis regulator phasin
MANRSGGSSSRGSGGGSSSRRSTRARRTTSTGGRTGASRGGRARTSSAGGRRPSSTARSGAATGADKSVEAFRDALERSVMLSRDRLQEVVDDAVRRGRMTRDDANRLVNDLITRGRQYSDDVIRQLERLLEQLARELDIRSGSTRRRATVAAGRAARAARDAADAPLARADQLRRRAGVTAGGPITAYDQLTANQIKARLTDLSRAELRQVRTREQRGKARKGVLDAIERRLQAQA